MTVVLITATLLTELPETNIQKPQKERSISTALFGLINAMQNETREEQLHDLTEKNVGLTDDPKAVDPLHAATEHPGVNPADMPGGRSKPPPLRPA